MITFTLAAIVLMLLAFALLLPALIRQPTVDKTEKVNQTNIEIGREQLKELQADREANLLTEEEFLMARSELEENLLEGLSVENKTINSSRSTGMLIGLLLFIPLFSISTYFLIGSQNLYLFSNTAEPANPDEMPDPNEMVAQLSERLKTNPEDEKGWILLARSYLVMERNQEAIQAFEKALNLSGENSQLLADYADAIGRANQGDLTGEAKVHLEKALALDPNNGKAKWLTGLLAYQEGDHERVIEYLKPLLTQTEPGSEIHQSLKDLIKNAEQTLGIVSEIEATSSPVSIKVQVSLSVELQQQTNGDETVFVFAKALQGPPMPLAVARLKAADLPSTVILDDSMAMRPELKLSSQENVHISARLSKTGNAIKSPGDWQGDAGEINSDTQETLTLEINKQLQ